jgi:type III secretory pathway component EscV
LPELEDRIAGMLYTNGGGRFLAAPVADVGALRNDLDGLIAAIDPDNSALVVLTAGLRPFVQGLVAPRHPTLPVLAYSELPDGSMPRLRCLEPTPAGG